MRERGLLLAGPLLWGAIAAAAVVGILGLVIYFQDAKITRLQKVEAEYEVFKEHVKKFGEDAEARRLAELERQKRSHDDTVKSYEKRLAAARARADELCKSAGLSAGCRSLPTVPDTARPVDAAAYNQRLVDLLRHAQEITDRLIELQLWVDTNLKRAP